jgi:hypothetical protein
MYATKQTVENYSTLISDVTTKLMEQVRVLPTARAGASVCLTLGVRVYLCVFVCLCWV